MNHAYNSDLAAAAYREFLSSENGKIFREVVGRVILDQIHNPSQPPLILRGGGIDTRIFSGGGDSDIPPLNIRGGQGEFKTLDAGCGDGWLAGMLSMSLRGGFATKQSQGIFHGIAASPPKASAPRNDRISIFACDAGEPLILEAKQKYPNVEFSVCDLNHPLPYADNFFDIITASMVLHDVEDEVAVLKNFAKALKPDGRIIASIVNPYYGYPVGEWKRGLWGRMLNKKPRLKLARHYNLLARQNRPSFEWRSGLGSHFTPLSQHIHAAREAGLVLTNLIDITSETDSKNYDLNFQLHRFPIILLLEFGKM